MSFHSTTAFPPGTEIAGHLVLAVIAEHDATVRLRARDARGRGSEVAVTVWPGADEAARCDARHQAQRLAGLDEPGFCVPTDIRLTDRGLVVVRPWFDTTLALGARAAGLSARRCIELVIDLAHALAGAHRRGLGHGAVDPANVMIAEDGTGRLVDAAAGSGPGSDDTVALSAAATAWLGEFDESPLIDRAREQCAAAAAGQLTAPELADRLERIVHTDPPQPDPWPATAGAPQRDPGRARRGVVAAIVAVAAAAAVSWAATLDQPVAGEPVAVVAPALCDPDGAEAAPPGAEVFVADLYGEGCGRQVTWWPVLAEAEIDVGASAGRYRLGRRGDHLLLADLDGDGDAEPALYRPPTGELFSWTAWPADGRPAPSTSHRDTGTVGGEPRVVTDGDQQRIEVVAGTAS